MMEHNPADGPDHGRGPGFLSCLLAAISLVFPVSVYYIGGGMGAGVAFPFFRYQQTYLGASLITLWRDIDLVTSGAISGRSALVPFFWLGGVLLCCAACGFAYWYFRHQAETNRTYAGVCLMAAATAYTGGIIAQYGFSFSGSAGFAVPIGAALLFVAGWFVASGFPGIAQWDADEEAAPVDEASGDVFGEE